MGGAFPQKIWLLLALLGLAGCGVDPEQTALCRRVIPAFEPAPQLIQELRAEAPSGRPGTIVLTYHTVRPHRVTCRFAGTGFERGRFDLIGVETDRGGVLTPMQFTMLRVWLGLPPPAEPDEQAPAMTAPAAVPAALYLLQLLVNALTLCCVYGLLAAGYSLVYGIIGRINLAFGEITMLGGMQTVIAATLATLAGAALTAPVLVLVLVAAIAFAALSGWALERLVFKPLRRVPSQAPLIAALGVSMALQEVVRLLQGARDRWLLPVLAERHLLAGVEGFAVSVLTSQIVIAAFTAALYGGLWLLIEKSAFGRAHRAAADDPAMAALLGIDVDRTVALTFVLGGACAGAAGFILSLYYGGANFYMGWLIGFKALTAAVVGGIGSLPGAMLGGVLIGVLETLWSGYLDIAYKDIAVFAVLVLCLVLRPQGLLGFAGRTDLPSRFG